MTTNRLTKDLELKKVESGRAGFTIIETLIGITILLLAVVGTLSIAAGGIDLGRYTEDRLTAVYLAQEGMEFIRFTRDSFIIQGTVGGQSGWNKWLNDSTDAPGGVPPVSECRNGSPCTVDVVTKEIQSCSGPCPDMTYHASDNLYGHSTGSGWQATNFNRSVVVQDINANEVSVEVTVSWEHDGEVREEVVQENLLGWYGAQ